MTVVAKLMALVTKLKAPTRIRHSSCLSVLFGLALLAPALALGAHAEISGIATQLYQASDELVHELHHVAGYSRVHHRAKSLRREADQLIEAVSRNRSSSRVRSQFSDLSRRYEKLEEAFLRANRNNYYPHLYVHLGRISDLYANLSQQFYYASYPEPIRQQPYSFASPGYYDSPLYSSRILPWQFGFQRLFGGDRHHDGNHDSGSYRQRDTYNNRHRDNQTSGSRRGSAETSRRNHYN